MKSAILTLKEGLRFCENWLRDNPKCSDDDKRIKAQQIKEHKEALDNLTSSLHIIHSQPTADFCYWIKHYNHSKYEVAEAFHDSVYDKVMFRCTNGGRIDPKYVSEWKREPIVFNEVDYR